MVEQEDAEATSSHGHTKTTTIYKATTDEKDQNPAERSKLKAAREGTTTRCQELSQDPKSQKQVTPQAEE